MAAIVDVLWLAGTFNAQGEGISATFANGLDPKRFRFRYVPYPADYGRGISYGVSLEQGRVALDKAVRACPGRVVVGGYSQGAAIAGNYAAKWADRNKVVGCALIADPLRDGYQRTVGHNPGGYGIGGGQHGVLAMRSNPYDSQDRDAIKVLALSTRECGVLAADAYRRAELAYAENDILTQGHELDRAAYWQLASAGFP